jgi:hypothetical protein
MNNKTLGIAFGVLLLIYLILKLTGGNQERSFDPEIIAIDTSVVARIVVDPSGDNEPFELNKDASGWNIQVGSKVYEANAGSIRSFLGSLQKVEAERIVSKNPERFADYSVDDSLGTTIQIFGAGSDKLVDVVAGRFNFNQATRSGISYLRLSAEEEVYSVDGFLSMTLTQGFESYRRKELLTMDTDQLRSLTLQKSGKSISINRGPEGWMQAGGVAVDSAAMAGYLSALRTVSGANFADPEQDQGQELAKLTMDGDNMIEKPEVMLYESKNADYPFIIHSNMNSQGYFFSDSTGLYNRLFGKFETLLLEDL